MSNKRPLRVLHISDTLCGGGIERMIYDIVRLSDGSRVKHRVVTIFPYGYSGPFVYAEPLRQLGAYGSAKQSLFPAESRDSEAEIVELRQPVELEAAKSPSTVTRVLRGLPSFLKKPLLRIFNAGFAFWQQVKRVAASYFPSAVKIPEEFVRFRPDVVYVHGFYSFKYGLLFKLLFRRPMVHMVPALFSQMEAQRTGWLAQHYRRFNRLVDCFVLHRPYRSELMGVGVPAAKLFDISGTLDLQEIARVKSDRRLYRTEVRSRLGMPEDALIALSVGRMDPSKGHAYALEALPLILKQFPNFHWVLLGEGATRPELEARIKELGLDQHAHLIGFDREPLPYYAAADIYLRTTTMEAENISSQQAIAMGLPTVGFDTCRESDLIGKLGHGIVVPNEDAVALAEATCRILSLPDQGREMGALGVDYCNSTLGIQTHIDDLISEFTSLYQKRINEQGRMGGLVADSRTPQSIRKDAGK